MKPQLHCSLPIDRLSLRSTLRGSVLLTLSLSFLHSFNSGKFLQSYSHHSGHMLRFMKKSPQGTSKLSDIWLQYKERRYKQSKIQQTERGQRHFWLELGRGGRERWSWKWCCRGGSSWAGLGRGKISALFALQGSHSNLKVGPAFLFLCTEPFPVLILTLSTISPKGLTS